MIMRAAIIQAATVEVLCPHCGDPQPSADNGSHMWMPDQVRAAQGVVSCVACDEKFRIYAHGRVSVVALSPPEKDHP
jgi:ribosomal protein S27E